MSIRMWVVLYDGSMRLKDTPNEAIYFLNLGPRQPTRTSSGWEAGYVQDRPPVQHIETDKQTPTADLESPISLNCPSLDARVKPVQSQGAAQENHHEIWTTNLWVSSDSTAPPCRNVIIVINGQTWHLHSLGVTHMPLSSLKSCFTHQCFTHSARCVDRFMVMELKDVSASCFYIFICVCAENKTVVAQLRANEKVKSL